MFKKKKKLVKQRLDVHLMIRKFALLFLLKCKLQHRSAMYHMEQD